MPGARPHGRLRAGVPAGHRPRLESGRPIQIALPHTPATRRAGGVRCLRPLDRAQPRCRCLARLVESPAPGAARQAAALVLDADRRAELGRLRWRRAQRGWRGASTGHAALSLPALFPLGSNAVRTPDPAARSRGRAWRRAAGHAFPRPAILCLSPRAAESCHSSAPSSRHPESPTGR